MVASAEAKSINLKEISPWRIEEIDKAEPEEYAHGQPMEEAHLRDYWKVVVRYRLLIVVVFITVFGVGAYVISGATSMYTAAATIKIDPQNPQFIQVAEVLNLQVQAGDYYSTQHELMKSRALAARVITDLGLESNPAFNRIRIISPDPVKWLSSTFFGVVQSITNFFSYFSRPKHSQTVDSGSQRTSMSKEISLVAKDDTKPKVNPASIGRYLGLLRVEPMRGTRLVKILFTTPDPNLSQQLANAHASAFVRMNLETRFEVTKDARNFLEKKLAELRSKIEASEFQLSEFRKAHGVVSMDRGENLIVDRMIALNGSLTQARIKRLELESLRQMLRSTDPSSLSEVITNATIQQYRSTIETLVAEQVKLSTVFKPDHPRMIELNTRLNETRQRMKTAIAEVVQRIGTDYESARNREASIEAESGRQKQAAIDLKSLGIQYTVLQAEVDANQKLYTGLLTRLTETTISNDLPVSNMQVTELADTPGWPSSGGQQLKLLMTTAGAALVLAMGLAFCLAYFDSTVSTSGDVWRFFYLPTLGVVPDLKSLRYGPHGYFQFSKNSFSRLLSYVNIGREPLTLQTKEPMISTYPSSVISESYRSIRTALLFSHPETPPQTVLFTSPGPAEGKTVTTLNLAIALAQSGKSVLLIDADVRKGRCHRLLHLANDKGLSNFLTGNVTLEESLQDTAVPGLSLLPRGVVPPNPPDLLGSSKMREALDELRNRFDFILLDASPVIGITDAEVLSAFCDGVVLVMHSRKTSRFSTRQALENLEAVRARVLGVVLNGVDLRNPEYASYRHYYSSYYASVNLETVDEGSAQLIENPPQSTDNVQLPEKTESAVEPTGSVSKQQFEHIIFKLSEAVGPLAPLIVQDYVALMGESMEAFPKSRLKELFEQASREILNDDLRAEFDKIMLRELQSA